MTQSRTPQGHIYYTTAAELADPAKDAERAANLDARFLEAKGAGVEAQGAAAQASADAAKALQTANSYAGQIAQANTTAGEAKGIAQGAEDTAVNAAVRMEQIEAMAGLAPGEVTDAQTANLIARADTATRDALNAAFAPKGGSEFWAKDYPTLNAAVNAAKASPNGGTVYVTENTTITTPVTLHATRPVSIIGRPEVVITAGAAMTAMIVKPSGYCTGIQLHDLNLDGAMLADKCVEVEQSLRLSVRSGIWRNAKVCVADFGRNGGQVYETDWRDTRIVGIENDRPGATPEQMPGYGYRFGANVTDSIIENVVVKNAGVGVEDGGNVNVHRTVHVFGYPYIGASNYLASVGFRITGSINRMDNCYADTQVLGFDIKGDRNSINAAMFYWPVDFQYSGDIIGIRLDSIGNIINGATTRFPTAGSGATQLKGYFIQVMPTRWLNIVTNANLTGPWTAFWKIEATGSQPLAVANAWNQGEVPLNLGTIDTLTLATLTATGTTNLATTNISGATNVTSGDLRVSRSPGNNRDLQYRSADALRWAARADSTAEGGSDAGSRYQLVAYTDAGSFKYVVAQADRRNGVMQFPQGIQTLSRAGAPTDADWATPPNDGTMTLDSTGSRLWVRVAGAWKSVTLA